MSENKVSVIIPTYNEKKNIARLLISIKNQSYKNVESIVVDDGSSDNTVEIAKKYANRVCERKHAERSVQRNFGAKIAKGKYLLFSDADMEFTRDVVSECVKSVHGYGGMIIPEKTVGSGFVAEVRKFERAMYEGDSTIEVARFFPKKVFQEFGGYDINLTGTEDYDLPKRISKKYEIGWITKYILHHETGLSLFRQLKKKYYYANKSALYVNKHPDLISKQGILILRKAYLIHWRDFLKHPFLGLSLIFMRILETLSAALGFMIAVGPASFFRTFFRMFKYK